MGPKGDRGRDGIPGSQGFPGLKGLRGDRGDPGSTCKQGDPGQLSIDSFFERASSNREF